MFSNNSWVPILPMYYHRFTLLTNNVIHRTIINSIYYGSLSTLFQYPFCYVDVYLPSWLLIRFTELLPVPPSSIQRLLVTHQQRYATLPILNRTTFITTPARYIYRALIRWLLTLLYYNNGFTNSHAITL